MGQQRGLAQEIVEYMAEYDTQTLYANTGCDGALAVMEAYDETMAQLRGDGWLHVAWYLITQLQPYEGVRECETYDLLERLFSYHGIG